MTIHLPAETAMALALAMTDPHTTLLLRRHAAEQAVEDLINFLDDTAGDCDLEDNGDERDGSWPAVGSHAFGSALDEGDEDADAGEDDGCTEPMLGSPEQVPFDGGNQEQWSDGASNRDDYEAINEDGGDVQDEPHDQLDEGNDEISLGWGLQFNQLHASAQACCWGDEDRWAVA